MRLASTLLMFCVAALLALGMVMLYSASMTQAGAQYLTLQLAWGGLGLAVCAAIAGLLDYRRLRPLALPLLLFSAFLLVLVFVPGIGYAANGARRWIKLGGITFQPSELAKIAGIIALAAYAELHQRRMGLFKQGVVAPGIGILLMAGLILAGRDFGATMLFGTVCVMMLILAGVRWRFIVPPALLAFGALAVLMWNDPVRRLRLLAWWYPEQYKDTTGYQVWQGMLALGAGGIDGRGLGDSRQKLGFVPEHHTDFILPVIGEELGLIATLAIVVAFAVIIICGALIASRARDPFGMYLGAGLVFLIGLQAFINIAVVTAVLPNKGLPLPFISKGGSNLLMMLISVGLLLSIARRGIEPQPVSENPFSAPPDANPFTA